MNLTYICVGSLLVLGKTQNTHRSLSIPKKVLSSGRNLSFSVALPDVETAIGDVTRRRCGPSPGPRSIAGLLFNSFSSGTWIVEPSDFCNVAVPDATPTNAASVRKACVTSVQNRYSGGGTDILAGSALGTEVLSRSENGLVASLGCAFDWTGGSGIGYHQTGRATAAG